MIYGSSKKEIEYKTIVNIPIQIVSPGTFEGVFVCIESANIVKGNSGILLPNLSAKYFPLTVHFSAVLSKAGGACSHLATLLRETGIPAAVLLQDVQLPKKFIASFSIGANSAECIF